MTQQQNAEQRIPKRDEAQAGSGGTVPNLAARTVVGIYDDRGRAQAAASDLRAAGFGDDDLSVVMRPGGAVPELGAGETKADTGTAIGASVGAVVGGMAGLAALAIPGIGPILAVGPLAAALGALTGGALGGLVGSFTGLGIPTEHAKSYEEAVRSGGIVIAVRAADSSAGENAERLLRAQGAREVASYTQAL